MTIILLATTGVAVVLMSRTIFSRWFNPIGAYTAIWFISLILFEVKLIRYDDLQPETWIIILGAWFIYCLGCLSVVGARFACSKSTRFPTAADLPQGSSSWAVEVSLLPKILWIINVIGMAVVVQYWYIGVKLYGSLQNIFIFGSLIYSERVAEGMPGTLPYLDAIAMSGAVLAGAYTAMIKKIRVVAILPLVIIVLVDFVNMGRGKMFFAAILFFSGYFVFRDPSSRTGKFSPRTVIPVLLAAAILWGGAEFVRSNRAATENLTGSTQALSKLRGSHFVTPSVYLYLTVHHGVFNQFLIHDDEHTPWGSNTFAPVYHILSKFGFDARSAVYQRFYTTPVRANTGTYLRELYADFGMPSVFLVPFFLGLGLTALWYWYQNSPSYVALMILAHVLLIMMMSLFFVATRAGDWFVSLFIGLIISWYLDKRVQKARTSVRTELSTSMIT